MNSPTTTKPRYQLWLALGLVLSTAAAVRFAAAARAADDPAAAPAATSPGSGSADPTALRAANALYDGIRAEVLANGLHVYLKPVPGSPVVTTMVAYKVGSADENLSSTGLSHYLEHLMFKGTDTIMPGDIDHMTLTNGGQNNAYTTENFTIFHFDFAADRWPLALKVEADRMRNLKVDEKHEFQQEKGAVISELKRDEDEPWDLEQKTIVPLLFGADAPYGHPVIGLKEQVSAATAAIIKAHYDRWYHPNNASLIVCGGFDPDQAMTLIKRLFDPIPSEQLPARKPELPIEHTEPIHKEFVSKFDVARMIMGFTTVKADDPDLPALEVVQSILSGGKTSRFYKDLVEGAEIATSADTGDNWGRYTSWFSIQMELLPGQDRQKAEAMVVAELKRLADEPVTAEELARVRQGIIAGAVFDRESVHQLADNIAQGVTLENLDWLKSLLPKVAAVTPADIQRVTKKYLDPQKRVVVWSVPKAGAADAGGAGDEKSATPKPQRFRHRTYRKQRLAADPATAAAGGAGGGDFSLAPAKRVVLPNGLVLLLWEEHRLPIVVASAHVKDVAVREPADKAGVAALTGELLDEGTTHHTDQQIAETIENVGGILSLAGSGGSVKVLTSNRHLGLSLLVECLTQPTFPADSFKREQQHQLAAIDDALREPTERALMTYRKIVYGDYPLGRPAMGTHDSVAALTTADCALFHKKLFVPNNTLMVIAGDINPDEVVNEIKQLTANWQPADLAPLDLPRLSQPKSFIEKYISMPDAVQLQFFMGHLGIRRQNPDYYKLLVLDYVLGTGPGFTDRLSSRLRDREGLAYTVTANIASSAGEQPGLFTCYIGTDAKNLPRVKDEFMQELKRIRAEAPTAEEVGDVQKYLLGELPFEFVTIDQISGRLLAVERYHLGFNYLADYRRSIAAVTPDDVLAMARKYLDPEHMVEVAAGAIDEHGKLLEEAPASEK